MKEIWSSRWVFILAAIGAAAGLGNLWRFPYMVYENGGGAFLFAYLLILFCFGLPLVIMEVAFGQRAQTEIVQAYNNVAGRIGRFVGWLVICIIALVIGYYATIVAWGVDFFMASPTLAWGNDAQGFFNERILNLSADVDTWGGFSRPVILGLIMTYLGVYFSIYKGIKSVGAVVKWTVPLPFVLLFILFLNSLSLEGAMTGFAYFLVPDWSQLAELTLWKEALSQAFFSMNIGLALTIMYASFNPQRQSIMQSGILIALGDALVSIMAGLAIFGTLGWMAHSQSMNIESVVTAGPTLAFVTFPTALSLLPFGAKLFAMMFFLAILMLAIDSLFAMVECVSVTLRRQFPVLTKYSRERWTQMLCVVCFLWSLCFAGGNGLYRLDILDHYLFAHLFYLGIWLQLLIIGWMLPIEKLRLYINHVSKSEIPEVFNTLVKYIAPTVFMLLYFSTFREEIALDYEGYSKKALLWWGLFPMCLAVGISWILSSEETK